MWYSNGKKSELDYKKAIVAETGGVKYLLLPQMSNNKPISSKVIGYNWFNLKTGLYNSFYFWKTPEEAVDSYKGCYDIYNVTIATHYTQE